MKSINSKYLLKNTSLKNEIRSMQTSSLQEVRKLYGQLGVDIYQGKRNITILEPEKKRGLKYFINKVRYFLGTRYQKDYEPNDSLHVVVMKHIFNKGKVLDTDVKQKFGEKGLKKLESFIKLGYLER